MTVDAMSDEPIPADAYAEIDEDTDDFIDVNPDAGLTPEPQEKTPEEPEKEPTPEPEPQAKEKPPAEPDKEEPQEDQFSFITTNDKGNEAYDMSKATEFLEANQAKQEEVKLPIQEPVKTEEPAQQPVNNMLENLLDPLRLAEEYAQQNGGDYAAAMRQAEQQVRQRVDNYDRDKENKDFREEMRAEKKDILNQRELVKLEPKSHDNLFRVALSGKWGDKDNLVKQIHSKQGLGWILADHFAELNEGKVWKTTKEYNKAYYDWFTKKTANLNWLSNVTSKTSEGVLMDKGHFKHTVKAVRETKARDTRNKQKATSRAPAPINRNQRNTKADTNAFDAYMNRNPYADKT